MKKTVPFVIVAALFLLSSMTGTAQAYPGHQNVCSGCHMMYSGVQVTAEPTGCSNGEANYSVTVTSSFRRVTTEWAVFDFNGSRQDGGSGTSGSFSVPADGQSYMVYGVSGTPGSGGIDEVQITAECVTTCPGVPEVCDDGIDNDCDGLIDGEDPDCSIPSCPNEPEVCDDGVDNDCDGMVDADDPDCNTPTCPGVPEICDDTIDNDCDGMVDADDPDCNTPTCPGVPEICDDTIDNDCDGLVDAADPDCNSSCVDGDGDGYYALEGGGMCNGQEDCNDSDPAIHPGAPEICDDGKDNNCNGKTDTQDPKAEGCPIQCTDADGDNYAVEGGECGPADCDDTFVLDNPSAIEDCYDGRDNDCDGLVDGADTDCGACVPTGREKGPRCDDGLDNDCDGMIDGDDDDCSRKGKKKPSANDEEYDIDIDNIESYGKDRYYNDRD